MYSSYAFSVWSVDIGSPGVGEKDAGRRWPSAWSISPLLGALPK